MGDGLSVALTRWRNHRDAPALELASIMKEWLRNRGDRPFVVEEGDPAALESDFILLFGDGRTFPRLRRLLRGRAVRPRTASWQFDPLPASTLPRRSERWDLAAARLSLRLDALARLWGVSWYRPAERWLPWPAFRRSAAAARGWSGERGGSQLRVKDVRGVLESDAWIRRTSAEGSLDGLYRTPGQKVRFLRDRGIPGPFAPLGWAPGRQQAHLAIPVGDLS